MTTDVTVSPSPPWAELVRLEPALRRLEREAFGYYLVAARTPDFCANAIWYGYEGIGLKERLGQLVGPRSGRPGVLGTVEAEDLAGEMIYCALPDCKRCGCGSPYLADVG